MTQYNEFSFRVLVLKLRSFVCRARPVTNTIVKGVIYFEDIKGLRFVLYFSGKARHTHIFIGFIYMFPDYNREAVALNICIKRQ